MANFVNPVTLCSFDNVKTSNAIISKLCFCSYALLPDHASILILSITHLTNLSGAGAVVSAVDSGFGGWWFESNSSHKI
jgi:hypothetical protein